MEIKKDGMNGDLIIVLSKYDQSEIRNGFSLYMEEPPLQIVDKKSFDYIMQGVNNDKNEIRKLNNEIAKLKEKINKDYKSQRDQIERDIKKDVSKSVVTLINNYLGGHLDK